jgi:peptidoglycan/xylan/chitin deacetylase (PgdA/CDA1 family)
MTLHEDQHRDRRTREEHAHARRTRRRYRRLAMSVLALAGVTALIVAVTGKGVVRRASGDSHAPQSVGRDTRSAGVRARGRARTASPNANLTRTRPYSEASESPRVRSLIALGKPIYCAGHRGNEVALTFDDGPGTYTKLAIAKLRKHGVGATFFVVGRNIALLPTAIRKERALGAVGDHTFTHPLLTSLSGALAESEIVRTQHALERTSGGKVFLFRPPYGAHNARIDSIARAHNLLEILWTVDSKDSLGASYAQIERNVIAGLHPGSIILMHENRGQTIRAMLNIFAALERKHLHAVSVPRLLTDDPPSDAQVRAGGLGCGIAVFAARGGD